MKSGINGSLRFVDTLIRIHVGRTIADMRDIIFMRVVARGWLKLFMSCETASNNE